MKVTARGMLAGIWGTLCLAAVAAPVLLANAHFVAAAACYVPFSRFCHQNPVRSFAILQYPMAVCHRCAGIYLGLFLGTVFAPRVLRWSRKSLRMRRLLILAAVVPLALDALLPFTGLWRGMWQSRLLTGFVFGGLVAPLLVEALTELAELARPTQTRSRRTDAAFPSSSEGEIS
ncbi:MAG: DUF2085 domain-containing protein [Acidobacteriota bacterium]|jgi:uncharacterized membrane protein|nr:DUF2085 domain-containing protein [Acidobacteriota bacterium]